MGRTLTILAALLAIAIAVPTAPSAPASAQTTALSGLLERGTLRVGMSGNQPPFNFRDKSGELVGMEVDLARSLAGMLGVRLEIVERPFGELLPSLTGGEVDLVLSGMTITPERTVRASFVGPYYLSGKSILTRSAKLAQVAEAGELDQEELSLAALSGSTSERFVTSRLPKAKLVATPDYDAAVKLLLDGKVDALVADREIIALTAFRNPEAGLAALREPLTIEPIGMAAPPGDAQMLNMLENAVDALEVSGLLTAIRVRWVERGDWVELLP